MYLGNENAETINQRDVANEDARSSENGDYIHTERDLGVAYGLDISNVLKSDDEGVIERGASQGEAEGSPEAFEEVEQFDFWDDDGRIVIIDHKSSGDEEQSDYLAGDARIFVRLERTETESELTIGFELGREILKSIVYGGLMEVIASLSVVASAVASDAGTRNIVALAVGGVICGLFLIGNNIWDLRNDCYGKDSTSKNIMKYKKLFGRVNYFPLHVGFTILSILAFGMIPPVAYAFSLRETIDKVFTVMVVVASSLMCVTLLSIFKAHINKAGITGYFKTVLYNITVTVCVSGVSYLAGNLATRLMDELRLFDMSDGGGMSSSRHATNMSLASS